VALCAIPLLGAQSAAAASVRTSDPVVVRASSVAPLIGVDPSRIVAFRYRRGWVQVPVQVDERRKVALGSVYSESGGGPIVTAYADPDASAGPDPNPRLDADDEIALMARDTGGRAPAGGRPRGVSSKRAVELSVRDRVLGATRYVYLFVRTADSDRRPGAGREYVRYDFQLASGGSYRDSYRTGAGPNPERSRVAAPAYRRTFSDRWIDDGLAILAGGATGAEILDRHTVYLAGACSFNENAFSNGEGGFLANTSGPVRAIRSFIGAQSGPYTQRDHVFYAAREDIRTYLRVHSVPGPVDLFDFAPAAIGMTHRSNLDPAGVVIDGKPDAYPSGEARWQLVDGPQGALVVSGRLETNVPGASLEAHYVDDERPGNTCSGDGAAYGVSGAAVRTPSGTVPNTDPSSEDHYDLTAHRVVYYRAPGTTAEAARRDDDFARRPLKARAAPRR
jgi:hypothetical protein